ncbi:Uridine kinase-like protein 1, chloroplastic, partial [Auxenochlorella protothecoides]
ASGKTTVCDLIIQRLQEQSVVMLAQDSFYRALTPKELENVQEYNFDVPEAFDEETIIDCLTALKAQRSFEVPEYDFNTHTRSDRTRRVLPADVVIIEGILVLHIASIRGMLNMKIYVDTDDDVRLARRIQRDVADRGRDVAGVIEQYTKFVKPAFDTYVAPSRKHADVIIPWARGDNAVAIDLITEHIRMKLQQHDLRRIYTNLEIIPSNYQIRGMHTIIRDVRTSKADFVFYADRLLRLVVEAGLGHLPFQEMTVITPTGHPYVGVDFAKKLCGVSIIRSGESMEPALRACCKGIKIGKILVHREKTELGVRAAVEREIVYEKLPTDIAERYVLLMDPILASGYSAQRAIQVLLDKGVDEGRILFLNLVAAPEGVHRICRAFPRLKLVTSEIDEGLEAFAVIPGVGEFGDRYFCD